MASFVEADGETIDEAIDRGLRELGVSRDQAQVEIVQDAKRGLLGFGGQQARVRVSRRGDAGSRIDGESREVESPGATPPGGGRAPSEARAAEVLREILRHMEIEARVEAGASDDAGQTVLRISSEMGGILIGRRGQTLEALEYLVNRIVTKPEERGGRILLDAEGYRERRKNELEENARHLAERVRRMKRPESMNPMSPRERRIVHMALAESPGVVTRSVGEGQLRRIVIEPARTSRGVGPSS